MERVCFIAITSSAGFFCDERRVGLLRSVSKL
jgi:hypothetical protein